MRLGNNAVGQAILSTLSGDFSPGDLKTRNALVRRHPRHTPQEAAGDISSVDGKRCRQVFGLGQNFRKSCSCSERERKNTLLQYLAKYSVKD